MKAIVLFSGGVDSTTCLALAVDRFTNKEVLALSLYYGQKHDKELQASKAIANYYNIEHKILDLKEIFEGSSCSLLKDSNLEIPIGSYKQQLEKTTSPLSTYVPYRNGLFLSVATSIALSYNASYIYYGAHQDETSSAYPDTSKEFNQAISKAIYLGSGKQVEVIAPFVSQTKDQIVKKGLELKVPYQLTWSCYQGKNKACGKCATCIDRQKAFLKNGIKDPIEYEVRIDEGK